MESICNTSNFYDDDLDQCYGKNSNKKLKKSHKNSNDEIFQDCNLFDIASKKMNKKLKKNLANDNFNLVPMQY